MSIKRRVTAAWLLVLLCWVSFVSNVTAQGTDLTPSLDTISAAFLLTAAGAGVAASIITMFVQLIKGQFGNLDPKLLALATSAVLMAVVGISTGIDSIDKGLIVFVAWLTVATASVGVYEYAVKPATSG